MKLTTWNIEHLKKPLADLSLDTNRKRLLNISKEIKQIDPDILCIIEAPGDLVALRDWVALPSADGGLDAAYQIATIEGTEQILSSNPSNVRDALSDLYAMEGSDRNGNQWIWFLVKNELFNNSAAHIQDPKVWRGMTGLKKWTVNYWGSYQSQKASHWRHPQTLILNIEGLIIEIIGVHLKSKINLKKAFDQTNQLTTEYVDEALRARVKLATEANDIRKYIEQRFQQESNPYIIVCGDFNDGPAKEFFERQYLFFDLMSNIQGNIFFADSFLNHALFDYRQDLRWSTKYNDKIERWARNEFGNYHNKATAFDTTRKQLIDHILFTQAFVKSNSGPKILKHAGMVEHTIHEKVNANVRNSEKTSDHHPVSVEISF